MQRNGTDRAERAADDAIADRRRRMKEAVQDVPDPKRGKVTAKDVETLREAGLDELAEVAEIYVST